MRHKTLTREDRRRAGPTTACQQILWAPQKNAAQGACKYRKKAITLLASFQLRLARSKQVAHLKVQSTLFAFKVKNLTIVPCIWPKYTNVSMVISIV